MKKFVIASTTWLPRRGAVSGAAHGDLVTVSFAPPYVTRAKATECGQGGAALRLAAPATPCCGFVGAGMLDAAAPAPSSTSPTPTIWRPRPRR